MWRGPFEKGSPHTPAQNFLGNRATAAHGHRDSVLASQVFGRERARARGQVSPIV